MDETRIINKIEEICDYNIQNHEKIVLIKNIIEDWREQDINKESSHK